MSGSISPEADKVYRALIDFAPDPILVIQAGSSHILMANHAAEDLLGYSREELTQLGPADLLAPEEFHRLIPEWQQFESDGFYRGEWVLRRKDGSTVPAEATSTRHEIDGRVIFQATFRDMTARIRAEEQLARRESQLAEAQRIAHLGSWEWDVVANEATMSDELCRVFGLEPGALISFEGFQSCLHPDDREKVRSIAAAALQTGEPFEMEIRVVRPDGEIRFVHSRGAVQADAGGRPRRMIGTIQDITERRRSEDALRASESELRALFAAMSDVVLILDRHGRHVRIAPTRAIMPAPVSQMLGKSIHEIFGPGEAVTLQGYLDEALRTGETVHAEYGLRLAGEDHWFDATISPISEDEVYWVARDITERKLGEENRARLSAIVESSRDAIIGATLDGVITNWNAGAERLFGYTADEAVGNLLSIIVPPDRQDELFDTAQRLGQTEPLQHDETVRVRKDGRLVDVSVTISPIRDSEGQTIGASVIARDITDWKRVVAALEESNRRSEQAFTELQQTQQLVIQQERLRALGEMASGIAHDFNNALGMMMGYTELLLVRPENLRDTETAKTYLSYIQAAGHQAADVVSRLREFYRPRAHVDSFQPVDLNHLVEEVVPVTQPRWRDQALVRGSTIEMQTQLGAVPPVPGDAGELREVLTNLIFNAVDAMPDGGVITITTYTAGGRVKLEVRDTGVGMPEEVRRQCLEPFFTTKGDRGTGLGLSTVHGIVRRHDGTLDIRSAPGQGTVFTISLPSQSPNETPRSMSRPDRAVDRPLRVLLAEDEPRLRDVLAGYLAADGHAVETAADGREALDKFQAEAFDVVVTDRAMPVLGGDELALAIQGISREQPVIMLTGFGELMNAAGERPSGVDIVIGKPVTMQGLREGIAQVVSR